MAEATIGSALAFTTQALVPEERGPITADLGTIVTRAARRFGAKTALIAPGRTLTYSELDDLCVAATLPRAERIPRARVLADRVQRYLAYFRKVKGEFQAALRSQR